MSNRAIGAKTATHIGSLVLLTKTEACALNDALDLAFADMCADPEEFRAQLRKGSPLRRAAEKVARLAARSRPKKRATQFTSAGQEKKT